MTSRQPHIYMDLNGTMTPVIPFVRNGRVEYQVDLTVASRRRSPSPGPSRNQPVPVNGQTPSRSRSRSRSRNRNRNRSRSRSRSRSRNQSRLNRRISFLENWEWMRRRFGSNQDTSSDSDIDSDSDSDSDDEYVVSHNIFAAPRVDPDENQEFECPICYLDIPRTHARTKCENKHRICLPCMRKTITYTHRALCPI